MPPMREEFPVAEVNGCACSCRIHGGNFVEAKNLMKLKMKEKEKRGSTYSLINSLLDGVWFLSGN